MNAGVTSGGRVVGSDVVSRPIAGCWLAESDISRSSIVYRPAKSDSVLR